MEKLRRLRKRIDKIDDNILILLARRIGIVKKIGKIKKQCGLKVIDIKRENNILKIIEKKADEARLDKRFIKDIFKKIIIESRNNER